MTDETAHEAERGGRSSWDRFEEMPHADPIAFLGTDRHPLGAPPTSHDVEPPIHADVLPRSRWVRRVLATALGAALVLPIAASFSSDESTALPLAAKPTAETPPTELAQPAALAAPQDLPPGGLSESATSAPAMSEERSVADWTDATQPRDGSGVVTGVTGPGPRLASVTRPVVRARHFDPRPGVPTTLDFAAAMRAVAAVDIGPEQCGPDALGTAAVAVTFAPSGRAARAMIENGPLRGTVTGSCVALELRNVRIAPFEGDAATVRTTILLR